MNKKLVVCLLALSSLLPLQAQEDPDDWGGQISIDVSKKIISKWTLSFEEEFRLHKNFSRAERLSHCLQLSYKPYKFLKGSLSYNLLNYYDAQDGWDARHRFLFAVTGDKSFGRFNLALRENLQSTYRPGVAVTPSRANPKWYLRSRLELEYDIKDCHFEPFASAEMYYSLNDPLGNNINRWRYIAGTKYKINKDNSLEFYYRYTNYADEEEDNGHMICIAYSFDL